MANEFINNKEKQFKFYSYRYFLISTDVQISFENKELLDKERKGLFRDIILNKLSNTLKIDKSFIKMHLYKEITKNLFICKLAKVQEIIKYEDDNKDFKKTVEKSYPFVYVIIDLENQIILIQEDSSVFKHKEDSCKKLYEYLKNANDSMYTLSIDEITTTSDFWEIVEKEKVYKLNLNIKSPNFFGGSTEAEELAKDIHETTNATETNIQIINKDGDLKLEKRSLTSYIKYIASGGGRWSLHTQNGLIKSGSKVGKNVNINNLENENNEELECYIKQAISNVDIRPGDDNIEDKKNTK